MNEREKIKEAEYFYFRMEEEKYSKENFRFNLSAFLSSARSVLQYAIKESERKTGSKEWYKCQISKNKIIKFLKNKRDDNIHTEPIHSYGDIVIHSTKGDIHMSDRALVTAKDKEGKIIDQTRPEFHLFKSAVEKGLAYPRYKFVGWDGNEDVFSLCKKYLDELKIIVENGKNGGVLT